MALRRPPLRRPNPTLRCCAVRVMQERIRLIGCCDDATAVVTDNGSMLSWGDGTSGQLGLGKKYTTQHFPQHLERVPAPVVSLGCGAMHMGIVTSEGEAYTWGLNTSQQLGHSFPSNKYMAHPHAPEIPHLHEGEKAWRAVDPFN